MLTWRQDLRRLTALGLRLMALVALFAGVTVVGPGAREASADEAIIRALAAARGQGTFFEIDERRALFLGAIQGVLYVESGPDALDGASLACPASYVVNRFQPTSTAEGYCTFARGDAGKIYARWTCSGTPTRGCHGRLTIESGTGRFAGITGEGELVVRSMFVEFTEPQGSGASAGPATAHERHGVLVIMPALKYRLP